MSRSFPGGGGKAFGMKWGGEEGGQVFGSGRNLEKAILCWVQREEKGGGSVPGMGNPGVSRREIS